MKKVMVGLVSEFNERRSRTVTVDGVEIAVFKLTGGGFRAVENRCPHKNGKLSEGIVCDHHVFCPLHDWKISLDNGLVQEPDEGQVEVYKVEVDGSGHVVLHIAESGSLAS